MKIDMNNIGLVLNDTDSVTISFSISKKIPKRILFLNMKYNESTSCLVVSDHAGQTLKVSESENKVFIHLG